MTAATLTFLTPLGLLVGVAAILPPLALAFAARRSARAVRRLGLEPRSAASLVVPAAAGAAACALLAVAAARPALRTTEMRSERTGSQVFFVVDISRSMAAAAPGAPTRLERARAAVARLREAVPDVPAGLAGLTDRILPYLLPTPDHAAFAETLRRSVSLETPPPQQVSTNATSFGALASLATGGFFPASAERRTCVLLSDGETRPYEAAAVGNALAGRHGCRLLTVRVGGTGEQVLGADGRPEPAYRPDPAAAGKLEQLADVAGGTAFAGGELGDAAGALRRTAEVGPVRRVAARTSRRELAPFAAGLALAAVVGLLVLRLRHPGLRQNRRPAYDGLPIRLRAGGR